MTENEKYQIVTPIGKVMYPHLVEKHTKGQYASNKHEVQLLIPKEEFKKEIGKEFQNTILKVGQLKIGKGWTKKSFNPLKDGDVKAKDLVEDGKYESLEEVPHKGHILIRAKEDMKPTVYGPNKEVWDDTQIANIKSGDLVRLVVSVWASPSGFTNNKGGVTLFLKAVQFVRTGQPINLPSATPAGALFDEIEISGEDITVADVNEEIVDDVDSILPVM